MPAAVFVIDPARSSLTASGLFSGQPLVQQSAGSLVTSYSGTIEIDLNTTTIRFVGAAADAATSGTYQPGIGGAAGTAVGDYGAQFAVSIAGIPLGTAFGAVRNLQFGITSAPLTLTGVNFNASGLTFTSLTGAFDYRTPSPLPSGSEVLTGNSATNVATAGRLETIGGVQTVTISVDATQLISVISPNDALLRVVGTIVATVVPEPATLLLALVATMVLVPVAWRARRA